MGTSVPCHGHEVKFFVTRVTSSGRGREFLDPTLLVCRNAVRLPPRFAEETARAIVLRALALVCGEPFYFAFCFGAPGNRDCRNSYIGI